MKEKFSLFFLFLRFVFHECNSLYMRFTTEKKTEKTNETTTMGNNGNNNSILAKTVIRTTTAHTHTMTDAEKWKWLYFCTEWKQVLFQHLIRASKDFKTSSKVRTRVRGKVTDKDRQIEWAQLQCSLININRLEIKKKQQQQQLQIHK